jgi:hypothetical protein
MLQPRSPETTTGVWVVEEVEEAGGEEGWGGGAGDGGDGVGREFSGPAVVGDDGRGSDGEAVGDGGRGFAVGGLAELDRDGAAAEEVLVGRLVEVARDLDRVADAGARCVGAPALLLGGVVGAAGEDEAGSGGLAVDEGEGVDEAGQALDGRQDAEGGDEGVLAADVAGLAGREGEGDDVDAGRGGEVGGASRRTTSAAYAEWTRTWSAARWSSWVM